jgi:hypothetical protein
MPHYPFIAEALTDAVSRNGDAGQAGEEQLELFTTAELRAS